MMKQWLIMMTVTMVMLTGCASEPAIETVLEVEEAVEVEIVPEEQVLEATTEVVRDDAAPNEEDELQEDGQAIEKPLDQENDNNVEGSDLEPSEDPDLEPSEDLELTSEVSQSLQALQVEELRAIWLSYLDLEPIFALDSEEAYRTEMSEIVKNTKALGLNTIMFQVRPFGDALYPSELFPTSYIISGREGDPLLYDPFEIAATLAHEEGLRIEAWINPYRIRTAKSTKPLVEGGLADTWLNDGSRRVLQSSDGTIVYNPSMDEVRARIVAGVEEIIATYEVDGVHFDDYFYPTTEVSFDEVEYLNFLHDNDAYSLEDWRRFNVNTLINEVYLLVQSSDRGIVFGISPYGDLDVNYNQLYADVALWATEAAYVDYLIPQIYFGFEHDQYPYGETLQAWYTLADADTRIMPGISVYKVGLEDPWAGDGAMEWLESEGIIREMIVQASNSEAYSGFALYRYGSLFSPSEVLEERMTDEAALLESLLIE